jgi:eukaryotic-like serine/threonine-protein kinase
LESVSETRSANVRSLSLAHARPSHETAPHGRYDVQEELARGGMGAVFRAYDRLLERTVALKRLSFPRDAALRARLTTLFQGEYDTLAQLAHPSIVEVYEYGIDSEGPYYTMELLSGGDLSKAAPLSFDKAARLLRDVASALALVHARRFIHRDLSPANVRLTSDGHAKLIDFGALASFGIPQEIVGTPAFIAPECLARAPLDQRADLYALGALAYWCVTGRQAVRAASIAELPEALERPLVMPSEYTPELPKGMEDLILSLLNHDPLARPGSAAEVMDRLSALANLPHEEQRRRVAESYLAQPPLVGRSGQLEVFSEHLARARTGQGGALWIEAAHGLGRTALLDAFARKAQLGGAILLRARAYAQSTAFGVLRALLRTALAVEPSLARAHPELSELSSAQDSSAQRSAADALERNGKLIAGSERCLLALAQRAPLVLMIDDAQLADPESLGLLAALAHGASSHPLLVVISTASGEALADGHAHARLIEHAATLTLTPLDLELLSELTTAIFGPVPNVRRLSLWLAQNGGENPRRCITLARLLLAREEIQYLSGTFSLPYDVSAELDERELEDATFARIAQLGPDVERAAQLLSAYELPASLDELTEPSDLSPRALLVALSELSALGIVKFVDGCYAFADQSLRNAVVRATGAVPMRALHLVIGRMMLARPGATLDMRCRAAYHLLRGGDESEGIRILGREVQPLSRSHESLAKALPALELALEVSSARGRSDADNSGLMIPLCLAGYYRDPRLFARYFRRTLSATLEMSGVKLAARLARFVGPKLGLIAALIVARLRYRRTRARSVSSSPFKDVLLGLFAVAGTGISAACASFDFQLAYELGQALSPFRALSVRHPANIVREFCEAVAEGRRGSQKLAEAKLGRLLELLVDPAQVPKLDNEVRVQILVGVQYALGMIQLMRASDNGPHLALAMEKEQRGFFAPHAELLRMLHHALRGDQRAAEPHRERTERLALLGGAGWSAVNNTAHRALLVYQWTQDSMALLRVTTDLRRFAPINPAVLPHLELAEAYLELLRGRPQQAVERYARLFELDSVRQCWTWLGDRGRYAEALNAVGRYEEARRVCEDALAACANDVESYRFLSRVPMQQWAIAAAQLGDHAAATARLDVLLAAPEPADNPLLRGALHRDRAHVALLAGDHGAFEAHLRAMVRLYRESQNPALIRQCERLYARGIARGFAPAASADSDPFPLSSFSAVAFRSVANLPENDVVSAHGSTSEQTSDQTEIVSGLGDLPVAG